MLRDAFESPGEYSPDDLRVAYDDKLTETIEQVGTETVTHETDIDAETLKAIVDGESPELLLTDAASILATDENLPDADTLAAEARDILLMGMSIAVLDVEALAAGIDDVMEPKEIQQKIEGRYPLSLDEYALLHQYIESQKR